MNGNEDADCSCWCSHRDERKLTAELEDKIVDADVCYKIYFTIVHNTMLFVKIAREGMEEVDKLLQQLN